MSQNINTWVPFNFEGNAAFGDIPTRQVWETLVLPQYAGRSANPEAWLLEQALQYEDYTGDIPQFGLYIEHKGPKTLGDFFRENGVLPSFQLPKSSLEHAPMP